MDSTKKWFNLGSGIVALFLIVALLGTVTVMAQERPIPSGRASRGHQIPAEGPWQFSPGKEIAGAFIWTESAAIPPGGSGTWTFMLYNQSTDAEWLDEATMQFPAGVTVTGSSNFTVYPYQDRYLATDGAVGNGATVTWSDVTGGWGDIYPVSEWAVATVNVTLDPAFVYPVNISCTISGDDFGGAPHDIVWNFPIPAYDLETFDHAPYYVTGDFTNVLVMDFTLTDAVANDWLDALTVQLGWHFPGLGPADFSGVRLYFDADNDGNFEPGTDDLLVASLAWDGANSWDISGLGTSPVSTAGSRYFLAVDVAPSAPDDAIIGFMIPWLFDGGTAGVYDPGDEGIFTVGGDVGPTMYYAINYYQQIINRYSVSWEYGITAVTDPEWIGPNANDLPVLDFFVPDNWYLADEMTAITFENVGTATSADLVGLQVWRDGISPGLDGDETVVGSCAAYIDNQHWYLDLSATPETIPVGGARLFLTCDITDTASNGATIQMRIPQLVDNPTAGQFDLAGPDEGVFFASNNDGPIDFSLTNGDVIVIDAGGPIIGFCNGVGDGVPDANLYGSYARQTTVSEPVLVGGAKAHTLDTLEVDTDQYGLSWGSLEWSKTIKWTVTYDTTYAAPDRWVVEGQNADGTGGGPGVQTARAQDGVQYFTDGNELSFYVMEDGTPTHGTQFYFYTTRNIVGLANPALLDDGGEAPGDEIQDELDKDEIIVSVDCITDPSAGVEEVKIYCTFDNSDPTTSKATVKNLTEVSPGTWWTNGPTPDNILETEVIDGKLVKFIVWAKDSVGNVTESDIQMFEIDNSGPVNVAPTFTWNTDNTLLPPNVVNVGDVLNLNVDLSDQESFSFTEFVSVKAEITALLNDSTTVTDYLSKVGPYDGRWTSAVMIADNGGTSGADDESELPADLAAVIQTIDHIGNMDETVVWNLADNTLFNGFDNFNPVTPAPVVILDQDKTPIPAETINIGDVVQVEVDVTGVDDTGVLSVHVNMQAYGWGAAEPLNDGGYDGDDVALDGIWSREFEVMDGGAFAVDQLNLDNTCWAWLTDDAGNPDPTPELIAPGNTLDIDTDAPNVTESNFDIAVNIGGANWLNYYGHPNIANPGDKAVVRWDKAAEGETDNLLSVVADLSEWEGPDSVDLVVDEGGTAVGSYNDWDGDNNTDLDLYGAFHEFVVGHVDEPETFCYLTVIDDAGNVVQCSTGIDEGTPAEPLSVDIIYPAGSLTVAIKYAQNPPKGLYAGINDTLFFKFHTKGISPEPGTVPWDIWPPNGGVAVDLTDFGFPFQTTPLVLTRGDGSPAMPDTTIWYGQYVIVGAGNVGALGPEIAVDKDIDFEATLYDDALNAYVDNFGKMIRCDNVGVVNIQGQYASIWITHANQVDDIAAIGDTIWFGFDNSDATGQDIGDISNGKAGVWVDVDRDGFYYDPEDTLENVDLHLTDLDGDDFWMGFHVVTDSSKFQPWALEDTALVTFGFYAMDDGMNTSLMMGYSLDSIFVDNIRPKGTLDNSTITDITTGAVEKVSVGDKVNVKYDIDRLYDNITVMVDLRAYGLTDSELLGNPPSVPPYHLSLSKFIKDVDDPNYILDVLPGNALIETVMEICVSQPVTDNAGNTYVPECVLPFDWTTMGVDNDAPVTAVPMIMVMDDHDFADKGNGIVNFGDRLDIHCDMSAVPDMAGGKVLVNLYGYGGNSSDNVEAGLILTDDAFSQGGEGDLVFSFVLEDPNYTGGYMKGFVVGSGPNGAPGEFATDDNDDGEIDNAEELFTDDDRGGNIDTDPHERIGTTPLDTTSAIAVMAYDDDGCPSESPAESPEFTWVVDTQEPGLDGVRIQLHDSDMAGEPGHGIANIGDTLAVHVDALVNNANVKFDYYGDIPVTVDMSSYGYSENEPISIVTDTTLWGGPKTWSRMFLIQEGDDGIDVGTSNSASRIAGTGWDDADNWMILPIYSSPLPYQVDSDMPAPVTGLTASPVQGGRIKLTWTASTALDVAYYHIYQSEPDADTIDYTEPTESISPASTMWYSDTLEVGHTYLFGVRVEDDAGNIEQNMNVASGEIIDSVIPFATITYPPNGNLLVWGPDGAPGQANVDDNGAFGVDDPGEVGMGDDYTFDVIATMSDMDVVKADYYWRIKDTDPLLDGDQPGPWVLLGTVDRDPGVSEQETFTLTLDGSAVPSNTYEVIVVPTDAADNFPTHMEAYEFSHITNMWDNDDPNLIYLSVNGDASPDVNTIIPQGIIPMIAHAEDYGQQFKGQVPDYLLVMIKPDGYQIHVKAYEAGDIADWPHHFTINTTGFPDGIMEIQLWLLDPSGNMYQMPEAKVTITDVSPPTAMITNPEHGDHITGSAFPIIVEPGLDAYGNPVTDLARVDAYYSEDGNEPWNWIGFDTTPEEDKVNDGYFMIPWNTNNLVHGEDYFLFCEITDNSANKDSTETVMVIKDTTAMPVEIHIDGIVEVNGEERIHGEWVKVEALASDPNIDEIRFDWRHAAEPDVDGSYHLIGTDDMAPYWVYFDTEEVGGVNFDQQNYPIVIRAKPKDSAGNYMSWATYDVVVDNKKPWLNIYSINGYLAHDETPPNIVVSGATEVEILVHTMDDDIALMAFALAYADPDTQIVGIAELTDYESYDPVTGVYTWSADWTVPVLNNDTQAYIGVGSRDECDNGEDALGQSADVVPVTILGTESMTVLMSQPMNATNIMGSWPISMIKGTTGNTDVASAALQVQTPGEPIWHTHCIDMHGPTWENPIPFETQLFADGDLNMRWEAMDADGNPDPNPVSITVTVDNTPPVAVIGAFDMERANKEILVTAECSDPDVGSYPADVQYVDFWVKLDSDEILNYAHIGTDFTAPYELMYDTRSVPSGDGFYHFVATGTDNAGFTYGFPGNMQDPTYAHFETLEIDNCGPADLMIADIGDDHNPPTTGATLPQEEDLSIVTTSTDLDVAWMCVSFKHEDDADYNEIGLDTEIEIIDGQAVATFVWNTMHLLPGEMYWVEVCAGDDLGNESVEYYQFTVGLPIAMILSIDDETGEIVAECNQTAQLVKFDYAPALSKDKAWYGIGISQVDGDGYAKIIWHYDEMAVGDGDFKVRAWASDDSMEWAEGLMLPEEKVGDWTFTKTGNHFDIQQSALEGFYLATPNDNSDPKLIQVNIWVPSGYGAPSLYVVIDDGPNDPTVGPEDYEVMLIPSASDPNLYEPDPNCQVRLDPISTGGVADFYATLPSIGKGAMEVLTDQIVVAEVTLTDGGSTTSESGNWSVSVPPGALNSGADGLVARDVAVTPQSPSHQLHLKPIGGAVSVFMVSNYWYWFNSGYYATFVAHYDGADLPEEFDEKNISVAWWDDYGYGDKKTAGEWEFSGLRIIALNTELNTLTFNADFFYGSNDKTSSYGGGTIFSLLADMREENQGTIVITDPMPYPVIEGYTWAMPDLVSYVTDAVSGIDHYEVEMWLDGICIWDDNQAAAGFGGHYDGTSGELRVIWDDSYYEGSWRCAPVLMGGEHTITVTAMNNVGNYWHVSNTFTVEYPDEGSITDITFLEDARLVDGVWHTSAYPSFHANIFDPFARMYYEQYCELEDYYAGVVRDNIQIEIDGNEYYGAWEYYCDDTGYWGVVRYEQPDPLTGGQHEYSITLTRNKVSYTATGTFVVESVDVSSIKQVWFEQPTVNVDGVDWTNHHPVIKANISDLFGTLSWSDIELRIDGKEYDHVSYECGLTGDAGIMTYQHPYSDPLSDGQHSFTIGVTMNGVTFVTEPHTFMVDAVEPSLSGFSGGYVGATPSLTFTLSDLATGVDTKSIHLDLYHITQTTSPPNDPERKEFLYTAFPSMMTFSQNHNDVTVTYHPVLNLQDGEEFEITLYGGTYTTSGYDADDTGDRFYRDSDGIFDKVGNILTPATKRYIVDVNGPQVEEVEVMEDGMVCYTFQDLGAGLTCEDIEITMDGEAFIDYECEQLDRTRVAVCFDPGDIGAEFKIKVTDAAGNFTIERFVNETEDVFITEAHCYPNPATEDKVTIVYHASKRTGVEMSIRIYDFAGEPVKTLYRGAPAKVGENAVVWYMDDDNGKSVGRGAYICRIVAMDDSKTSAKTVKIAVAQTY